jgi:hypothetical protein
MGPRQIRMSISRTGIGNGLNVAGKSYQTIELHEFSGAHAYPGHPANGVRLVLFIPIPVMGAAPNRSLW